MTGASRGLGRAAAEQLLRGHPELHLLIPVRGAAAGRLDKELASATGNPNVSTLRCDLASLDDIRATAAEIGRLLDQGAIPPLGGFIGNAGTQWAARTHSTVDGYETTFAVNVLANYLFLRLLHDRFGAPARLLVVGSDTHFGDFRHNMGIMPAPRWEELNRLAAPGAGLRDDSIAEGRTAYTTSKLAVVYLVHAFARRLPDGVDIYTYDPGYVHGTDLFRDAPRRIRAVSRTVGYLLRATPVATGTGTAGRLLAQAAVGPRPGDSGAYLDRGKAAPSSGASYDRDREEQLWAGAAAFCALNTEDSALS
ncbi:SDR family NAD(P)-dependent oxidoreductase [Streptomyces sp. NPDC093544]|uniref:SDR family NAD(P)-dependent oxidoreductase n=1 Tax=Streptomyces sp. NPDC093544 TaxID=3155200 RepID=UPI0034441484